MYYVVYAQDQIGYIQQAFCASSLSAWHQVHRLQIMSCWKSWRISLPTCT